MMYTPTWHLLRAPRLLPAILLLILGSSSKVDAQPILLGGEVTLRSSDGLSSAYSTLAVGDGFLVAAGAFGPDGQVELDLQAHSADLDAISPLGTVPSVLPNETFVVDDGAGGAVVLWRELWLGSPYRLAGRHFSAMGAASQVFELTTDLWAVRRAAVTSFGSGSHSGEHLAAWRSAVPESESSPAVWARFFDTTGPRGRPFALASVSRGLDELAVSAAVGGGFLVLWSEPSETGGTRVLAQRWLEGPSQPIPGHRVQLISEMPRPIAAHPAVTAGRDGGFQVVWRSIDANTRETLLSQRLDAAGRPMGTAVALTSDGLTPQFGGLRLTLDPLGTSWAVWTRGTTGQRRVYARLIARDGSPRGPELALSETSSGTVSDARVTLGADGRALVTWLHDHSQLIGRRLSEFPRGACVASPSTLCLGGGRFRVEVTWSDYEGATGRGRDSGFGTPESGLFWFFRPDNWELLVKVIDGCAFNGHYWVYAAATTDIATTLSVTDTLSGETRHYSNPLGHAATTINDVTAFTGCQRGPR